MNQAYKEALAIIVRQLLVAAGTSLGVSGLLTPYLGELTNHIVAALIVTGAAGWSQIVQRFKRRKLMQALNEAEISEHTVEARVKSTMIPTPPVTTPKDEVPQ